jgi:hypothetical protein
MGECLRGAGIDVTVFAARLGCGQRACDRSHYLCTSRSYLRQLERHRGGRRRWLHTWTADNNSAMQAVNARFGFRAVEKLHEVEKS